MNVGKRHIQIKTAVRCIVNLFENDNTLVNDIYCENDLILKQGKNLLLERESYKTWKIICFTENEMSYWHLLST